MEANQVGDKQGVKRIAPSRDPPLKILIIKTRSIGDNIAMLPALRLLREQYPDAEIEVLTTKEAAAPLMHVPAVDAVHCFRKHAGMVARVMETLQIMRKLRSTHFDLVINLQASSGSEVLALLAGAQRRLIYPYHYGKRSRLSHYRICKPMQVQHAVLEDIDALTPLGIIRAVPRFSYPLSAEPKRKARRILQQYGIDNDFIVIHPGGGAQEKIWKPSYYGALIDLISTGLSLKAVILFTQKEQLLFEDIARAAQTKPVGLKVPFDVLAGIIEACTAFIGSDSAPHHVACSLDVPSLVLMSRDRRATWHPYDEKMHMVLVGEGKAGGERSIDRITPEEVFVALKRLLRMRASC